MYGSLTVYTDRPQRGNLRTNLTVHTGKTEPSCPGLVRTSNNDYQPLVRRPLSDMFLQTTCMAVMAHMVGNPLTSRFKNGYTVSCVIRPPLVALTPSSTLPSELRRLSRTEARRGQSSVPGVYAVTATDRHAVDEVLDLIHKYSGRRIRGT